jgi:signal transduction histidine kinase
MEEALQKAKDKLETRVQQRTAELTKANVQLGGEIEDRKRAQEAVESERKRLYSVMQMLPGYVILHARDHKVRFANDRFLELFGEPGDRPCYDIMRRQKQPCDTCQVLSVLDAQALQEWEWTCLADRTYHVWGYPFTDVDQTQVMLELGIDITERKNLEAEILRISELERQRIGQDLHDSLSQTLSGISCLSQVLHNKLAAKSMAEAAEAKMIESLITDSIKLTYALARGLIPVGVASEGLMSALTNLASNVASMFNIRCIFQCDQPVLINDRLAATHMYRIAQEAINNAVRHGQAQNVIISLALSNGDIALTVEDDGAGLPEGVNQSKGMGLRIMDYRARTIGASLSVQPRSRGGTCLICRLKQTPQRRAKNDRGKGQGKSEKSTDR